MLCFPPLPTLHCSYSHNAAGAIIFFINDQKSALVNVYADVACAALPGSVTNVTAVVLDVWWQQAGLASGDTGRLGCYCEALLRTSGVEALFQNQVTPPGSATPVVLCEGWATNAFTVAFLTYGAAGLIAVLNLVLRVVIYAVVRCERHTTRSAELRARSRYLFLVHFINTAAIILLLNAAISTPLPMTTGLYADFVPAWYANVATALSLAMLFNVALVHTSPLVRTARRHCRLCYDRGGCGTNVRNTRCNTQSELNELYSGIPWTLDERFAQLYAAIFVCIAYSTGIPLLLPVLAVTFTTMYWFDKWAFTSLYATPVAYDGTLARSFSSLLPLAMLMHAGFSVWMLTDRDIFPPAHLAGVSVTPGIATWLARTGSTIDAWDPMEMGAGVRALSLSVLPLTVLFVVILAVELLRRLILPTIAAVSAAAWPDQGRRRNQPRSRCCVCLRKSDVSAPHTGGDGSQNVTHDPTYWQAVPPDVYDAVRDGEIVVKPRVAAQITAHLADAQTQHGAARDGRALPVMLREYERLRETLLAFRVAEKHINELCDAFLTSIAYLSDPRGGSSAELLATGPSAAVLAARSIFNRRYMSPASASIAADVEPVAGMTSEIVDAASTVSGRAGNLFSTPSPAPPRDARLSADKRRNVEEKERDAPCEGRAPSSERSSANDRRDSASQRRNPPTVVDEHDLHPSSSVDTGGHASDEASQSTRGIESPALQHRSERRVSGTRSRLGLLSPAAEEEPIRTPPQAANVDISGATMMAATGAASALPVFYRSQFELTAVAEHDIEEDAEDDEDEDEVEVEGEDDGGIDTAPHSPNAADDSAASAAEGSPLLRESPTRGGGGSDVPATRVSPPRDNASAERQSDGNGSYGSPSQVLRPNTSLPVSTPRRSSQPAVTSVPGADSQKGVQNAHAMQSPRRQGPTDSADAVRAAWGWEHLRSGVLSNSRVGFPATPADVIALHDELAAKLTIPDRSSVEITLTAFEAGVHAAWVRATMAAAKRSLEAAGNDLYTAISQAIDRRTAVAKRLGGVRRGIWEPPPRVGGAVGAVTATDNTTDDREPVTDAINTDFDVDDAQDSFMSGLWSYDLHMNRDYGDLFGVNAVVAPALKRHIGAPMARTVPTSLAHPMTTASVPGGGAGDGAYREAAGAWVLPPQRAPSTSDDARDGARGCDSPHDAGTHGVSSRSSRTNKSTKARTSSSTLPLRWDAPSKPDKTSFSNGGAIVSASRIRRATAGDPAASSTRAISATLMQYRSPPGAQVPTRVRSIPANAANHAPNVGDIPLDAVFPVETPSAVSFANPQHYGRHRSSLSSQE